MRTVRCAAGLGAMLAAAGCADRFHPAANDQPAAIRAAQSAPDRLLVSALPADLSWLSGSLKLYREIGRNPAPTDDAAPRPADWMSVIPASRHSPESGAGA